MPSHGGSNDQLSRDYGEGADAVWRRFRHRTVQRLPVLCGAGNGASRDDARRQKSHQISHAAIEPAPASSTTVGYGCAIAFIIHNKAITECAAACSVARLSQDLETT